MMKNSLRRRHRHAVLINCSNLHVGGGVAVASSFIDSLSGMKNDDLDISLLLSTHVSNNISSLNTDLSSFKKVMVKDYYGLQAIWQRLDLRFKYFDVVFTVFGPSYFIFRRSYHIIGFARPGIIYPDNPVSRSMSFLSRTKQLIEYKAQEIFFSRSDEIVVELEHVKRELKNKRLFKSKKIHVVYSAVDSVFKNQGRWEKVGIRKPMKGIRLGLISRNYPHKNLSCLPELKKFLRKKYKFDCDFYVTFTDTEWKKCSRVFKNEINNVGTISLAQCPSFYSQMDGVIFPSLLECFSAVPIESLMMKKPLFASDLPFVKDCCQEHAHYFDPFDIESMGQAIYDYYSTDEELRVEKMCQAYNFVLGYPDAEARAVSYINIIKNSLSF